MDCPHEDELLVIGKTMNNSSAWLKEVLAGLPASGCVLYVRTADTEGGASLSQDDMRRSNMFGALLNGQLAGVVSAPGNKSVETATYILEGAGVPVTLCDWIPTLVTQVYIFETWIWR